MTAQLSPAGAAQAESQQLEYSKADSVKGSDAADTSRRNFRASNTAARRVRRLRFIARFIYWSCKHGSTTHAAWVCNYEGLYW